MYAYKQALLNGFILQYWEMRDINTFSQGNFISQLLEEQSKCTNNLLH